ncbi:MAG: aldehyde dehydrogenase family protein [Pirellulaceae bacterium]
MTTDYRQRVVELMNHWGASQSAFQSQDSSAIPVFSPINGNEIGRVAVSSDSEYDTAVKEAQEAFLAWRMTPAPIRGDLIRRLGERLREEKENLATLVTLECGKIYQEALGEVQEMIDICEFAVGLSRQLYGLTISSERPRHRLMEQWHPLGPVGVISAFNFPVAVWSWNAALAIVCGDPVVWKPSEKTPLTAVACHAIATRCAQDVGAPEGLFQLVIGDRNLGMRMAQDRRLPLVSATGSTAMGKSVGENVGARLGRSLLELGGNNAAIVAPSANLKLMMQGAVFAAVGTCGQRCTSLRRLIVHESIREQVVGALKTAFANVRIGNPLDSSTLVGPLIDRDSFDRMQSALERARQQGGNVVGGERISDGVPEEGYYVRPALVEIDLNAEVVQEETFAPILYVGAYQNLDEAIAVQNSVTQGLSSSIFTNDMIEAERFCSPEGSDCGIANVNIGTSGAEIGGAFGGEKDTGGGRESGSDAWKSYMRRATNTVNYSPELPLAQGIKFDL